MSLLTIEGVAIRAVTAALPERRVTEEDFAELFGAKEVARIAKSTGIQSIRETKTLHTSDLIIAACRNLLDQGHAAAADIDGLIVVTQTPDSWVPGVGFMVQQALGLPQHCLVLNVAAGCSGYISALVQAGALISSGACKKILLCTGDVTTRILDERDRHVKMLFGDAASATLLEPGAGKFEFICGADGSGGAALQSDIAYAREEGSHVCATIQRLQMDGTAVMNFALNRVPQTVKALLDATGSSAATLDLLVLHQANEFMLNYLRRMIGVAAEKMPVDIDGVGNTSSTSIPIVLSRHATIGTPQAEHVVLCGFGAGLSWGALKVDLRQTTAVARCEVPEKTALADTPASIAGERLQA
ncbi:ketoacyl-ACP synthase III [Pseudomonas sp. MG-9]|uniref:Ketoacyl-ACP synthase III n=1 Tax=Pseudomonas serboccidentalis TaxID=2964670 RepID=A0ABY7Z7H6_9PSED|nr:MULTISPECIES: ketoacyl-ACP synthase III [Pseudomonas]MBT9265026.1 ketoacyl-ACP synthase III [Pseudomonas sp. MG-9]WDR34997.1 ketoacyl-ACP synthase III [Pseudomonas serboccidentalis]